MGDRQSKSEAGRGQANWRVRLGAAFVVVYLVAIGVFALPFAKTPEKALPTPSDAVEQDQPADDYVVSDGAVVPSSGVSIDDQQVNSEDEGDNPEIDYEIVTDDGIESEHQGGVVVVQIAEGCTIDELNAGIKGIDCLASQTVTEGDVSLGYVKLRLADGVSVPDATEALNASAVLQGAQPNYVYRLDEADENDEGKPNLQVGSYIAAPEPIETEPTGALGVSVEDYWNFVDDPIAWNQMVIMAVRLREAYLYTHDGETHVPKAWNIDDTRPAIAILDTGCFVDHEDLTANALGWYDAVNKVESKNYIESHGTHVAGIAAAVTNNATGITGVSLNAKFVSVKVFKHDSENGTYADSLDILSGYEYVIKNAATLNIRVANMSLGATTENTDNDDKALLDAVDRAYNEKGILTTISAGNDANIKGGAYYDYPSDFAPNAIGVIDCGVTGVQEGGYPQDDQTHLLKTRLWLTRDSYSNFNLAGTMNKQLSALGSSVMSTVPAGFGDSSINHSSHYIDLRRLYGRKDGTSMASPCVAGIAALALSVNPGLTADELKSLLYTSAVDVDESAKDHVGGNADPMVAGFDPYTGFGTVDAYNAVVAADTSTYLSGKTLVAKGGTLTLSIPEEAQATNVSWGSSNGDIATVTGDGRTATVGALKGGQVIISATCTVPAAPSTHGAAVAEGDTRVVTMYAVVTAYDATITGENSVQYGQSIALGMDVTAKNGTWEWSSSDTSVATVDKWAGEKTKTVNVNGKKPGTATITATLTSDRSIKVSKTVTVTQVNLSSATVNVSPSSYEFDGAAKTPGVIVRVGSTTLRNGTDYTVSYSNNVNASSNARVTVTGRGNYTGTASCTFAILPNATQRAHSVKYRTHVQNVGWQGYVKDGATSGTSGRSLRLEGINVSLANKPYSGSIRYRTHIQNIGWEKGWKYDGAMSGTSGKSYRLEAIQIELTGEIAKRYDVYYRVHCQSIGWMGWAKNGMSAGSQGYSYRLEAIQIKIVPKGASAPGSTSGAFRNEAGDVSGVPDSSSLVLYRTHVQNDGWQNYMRDGEAAGTSGRSLRLEGINIKLGGAAGSGGIQYRTHVQNIGWQSWVSNGKMAGTSGQSLRLEAIEVKLTGAAESKYDVYYRVHSQNFGWMGWAKNGQRAGTAGYGYRLEAIQIKLAPKGAAAPGSTANAFRQR